MSRYPEPQLATLIDTPPDGQQWIHELKLDGYRLLGFVAKGVVRLRTRNSHDWTARFPSVVVALEHLKVKDAVLDMEAVVVDAAGKSSFAALQTALGDGGDRTKIRAYVFDLLHVDGKDLTALPLIARKKRLQALFKTSKQVGTLQYSEHIVGQGAQLFARACGSGLEGIVSKQANAPYMPGRQKSWLKIKCSHRQEFIILGFSAARTGNRALGALYLGYRKAGMLHYAGKVGTGFSIPSARQLVSRFAELAVTKPTLSRPEMAGVPAGEYRNIRWITPELLGEVAFTEWTPDGRIRHPSFRGLREDKESREVTHEVPETTPLRTATPATGRAGILVAGGITITHPDRLISEAGQITKGELAEYDAAVAPFLLPRIARHPLSLLRCPSGIDGKCFFQRSPGRGLGADVHSFTFRHKGKKYEYLYIDDESGLLEVVQMGTLELHPWGASIDAIDCPDRLIFDLDPAPDVPFEALKLSALDLRQRLKRRGLESTLKCTGGKGLHVTVALVGTDPWPVVKAFAAHVAEDMVTAVPEAYVATMSKAKRTGKIFIDYFRNDYTATAIADFSVRARPGMPVAVPLAWGELKSLSSANQFSIRDVLEAPQEQTAR